MIRVEALGKSFDNKKVLSDIDITFEAGKVNLIIGKSGSGLAEIPDRLAFGYDRSYLLR